MKNYIGIVRDHSVSMSGLRYSAMRDYNENIKSIKNAAKEHNQDTIVSVVRCGGKPYNWTVEREVVNSSVNAIAPLSEYPTPGDGTPLLDAVGEIINILGKAPDADDKNVSFLVMVITDGEENSSKKFNSTSIKGMMRDLEKTDRWTFAFRVPRGHKRSLLNLGIPEGNILEWDQTEQGFREATTFTTSGINTYYKERSLGKTSTRSFYTDMSNVKRTDLKRKLDEINDEIQIFRVRSDQKISEFAAKKLGSYTPGTIYYQLTKPERRVQEYKKMIIFDRKNNKYYGGEDARSLLNLDVSGTVSVIPGNHANYDIFIQSTSYSRKLIKDTRAIYWP